MQRVVIVRHHDGELHDAASLYLANNGYKLVHCYPFRGESLPDPATIVGTLVLGGAQHVSEMSAHRFLSDEVRWLAACLKQEIPVTGICLGAQLLAHTLGAGVCKHPQGLCEFGYYPVSPATAGCDWFDAPRHFVQAHFEQFEAPKTATLLAYGDNFKNQAFRYGDNAFGFQFHPEVTASMFVEWQNAKWAQQFYATAGAQSVGDQTELHAQHSVLQRDWFMRYLQHWFPPLPKTQTASTP